MNKKDFEGIDAGYDVLIVGAGPAGCMFSKHVNDSDFKCLLIDESAIPRNKPCGGVLVTEAKKFLSEYSMPETIFSSPKLLNQTYLYFDDSSEKQVKKEFYNINREKFDYWLFSLLQEKNIDFCEKTKLIDFYLTEDHEFIVAILKSNSSIRTIVCKHLISCEGAFSTVKSKLGKKPTLYLGTQEVFDNQRNFEEMYFIFDKGITDFYSWIIPKGEKTIIGSALPLANTKERFKILLEKINKRFGTNFESRDAHSALITRPATSSDLFLGKGNILVCGESAGLISPSSAEGISSALESGKAAAVALNSKKETLIEYQNLAKGIISRVVEKIPKSKAILNKKLRKELFSK